MDDLLKREDLLSLTITAMEMGGKGFMLPMKQLADHDQAQRRILKELASQVAALEALEQIVAMTASPDKYI